MVTDGTRPIDPAVIGREKETPAKHRYTDIGSDGVLLLRHSRAFTNWASIALRALISRLARAMLRTSIMRSLVFAALLGLASLASACATQRDTGKALVVTGATVAAIGASQASGTYCPTPNLCYNQATSASKEALKYALAGATVAAAGYALIETAPDDRPASGPATAGTPNSAPTCCRLQRRDPLPPPPPEEESQQK
jgi:hypothetical protein